MTSLVIFDTSVLIDDVRTGVHQERIEKMTGVVRTSSVVLAELWRGVRNNPERQFVRNLQQNQTVLTPTEQNWLESGALLSQIGMDHGFDGNKLRNSHFDVLIALTARSYGARLITSDRADFELISSYRKVQLEFW